MNNVQAYDKGKSIEDVPPTSGDQEGAERAAERAEALPSSTAVHQSVDTLEHRISQEILGINLSDNNSSQETQTFPGMSGMIKEMEKGR
jgi:hypothetical protein